MLKDYPDLSSGHKSVISVSAKLQSWGTSAVVSSGDGWAPSGKFTMACQEWIHRRHSTEWIDQGLCYAATSKTRASQRSGDGDYFDNWRIRCYIKAKSSFSCSKFQWDWHICHFSSSLLIIDFVSNKSRRMTSLNLKKLNLLLVELHLYKTLLAMGKTSAIHNVTRRRLYASRRFAALTKTYSYI